MTEPLKINFKELMVICELAYTIYRKCYLVARGAPQEFRLLVNELTAVSNSIRLLQDELKNPNSTVVRSGDDRVRMISEMIKSVEATLLELQDFTKKYEKLLDGSRSKVKKMWDKVKWPTEMSDFDTLRNRLVYHNGVILLLLTSAGNSSLQRLESSNAKIETHLGNILDMIQKSENAAAELPVLSSSALKEESNMLRYQFSETLIKSAELSDRWTTTGINEWIKAGQWWLLKYQFQMQLDQSAVPERKHVSPTAYATLIKASWILSDVIIRHPQLNYLESTIRLRVQALVEGVAEEFKKIDQQGLCPPKLKELNRSELFIWEELLLQAPQDKTCGGAKVPVRFTQSFSPAEDSQFDTALETFGYFQYPTGRVTSCLIQLLLQKADMKPRLLIYDQMWKILLEINVNPRTRSTIRCQDKTILIEGHRIMTGTDTEAQVLHVLLSALVEYLWWYQSPYQPGKEPSTFHFMQPWLKGFAMLFALGFGYHELINSHSQVFLENVISQLPGHSENNHRLDVQDPIDIIKHVEMIPVEIDAKNVKTYVEGLQEDRVITLTCSAIMAEEMEGRGEVLVPWLQKSEVDDWLTAKLIYTKIAISLNINTCWQEALYDRDMQKETMRLWLWYSQNTNYDYLNRKKQPYLGSIFIALALPDGAERLAILKRLCVPQAYNDKAIISAENLEKELNMVLVTAAENGIETVIMGLANCGININEIWENRTALQAAAGSGHEGIVRILLGAGADVNALNALPTEHRGRTALQAAAGLGHETIVRILLENGADVNALPARSHGKTALQGAAESGYKTIVRILLDARAEINARPAEYYGRTALQAAAGSGHEAVVRILLENGADINARPARYFGQTALQAAAASGHEAIVRILLEYGADMNAFPAIHFGQTALQAAIAKGHFAIARILRNAGARK